MKVLSIAFKDLQVLTHERGTIFMLFFLPLLFIVVFSGALTTLAGEKPDARIELPVVNLDGGPMAQMLLDGIGAAGGVTLTSYDEAQAAGLLDENTITRLLIIPADFSSGLADSQQVSLRLVNHPDADVQQTEAIRLVVEGVAQDMSLEAQIVASLRQMGDMQGNAQPAVQASFVDRAVAQAKLQFERSREQPLVAITQRLPTVPAAERQGALDAQKVAVPGFAVMFIFLTAQATARSIHDEKRYGSFRRLLAAPISRVSILLGKMLPNVVTGLLQAVVLFAFGTIGMRALGLPSVPVEQAPLPVALVILLTVLCSAALGILIAALARTESQVEGLSSILLWALGMLGGSLIPLFLLERFLGPVMKIIPHYWANRAFDNILVRGLGWGGITTEIAVLGGFVVVFFLVGLWRFDFE